MQSVKTFFITFLSSVCVVLFSFLALYWSLAPASKSAGTAQNDIPIAKADSTDNKTTLVFADTDTQSIFMLVKLNAVDMQVTVTAIPADYHIGTANRTLNQSFEYAGIMQCVQDLSVQLDIVIDYHIYLEQEDIKKLSESFENTSTDSILSLDNPQRLAFSAVQAIKSNMTDIQDYVLNHIPKEFSYLSTNIGKTEAAKLNRILTILQRSQTEYKYTVLTDSNQ
ncbi:MAG: hypothetical protein E7483_06180 [Ruminococcaceae bacterium]|nr:hypothetical protein [Oscillospiraceae bacterium]